MATFRLGDNVAPPGSIKPEAFGAVGDGITDDSTAIQAAITAAGAAKKPVVFRPVTYLINTELNAISLNGIELYGAGQANASYTIIKANNSIRSVLTMQSSYTSVKGIQFDANRQATHGLFIESCGFSNFENCQFLNATKDGINLSVVGVNDHNIFRNCWSYGNGTIFCTSGFNTIFSNFQKTAAVGTVACNIDDLTIVGTGTHFTQMGIRTDDFIRIGTGISNDQFLQIASVTNDTHIVLATRRAPTASLTGQDFAIAVGNGYKEVRHNDNNISTIFGGLWRLNAGSGMIFNGLYGPHVDHAQIDNCGFYGICVGSVEVGSPIYNTVITHTYFENCLAKPFLFGNAHGVTVINPVVDGSLVNYHIGALVENFGIWTDQDGLKPIGNGYSTVPTTQSYTSFQLGGTLYHNVVNPGTPVTGTTIQVSGSLLVLPVVGNITMTATPTLSTGTEGQEIIIINQTGGSITFQDEGTLPNSTLKLAASTITLSVRDSLRLVFYAGKWIQVASTVVV